MIWLVCDADRFGAVNVPVVAGETTDVDVGAAFGGDDPGGGTEGVGLSDGVRFA